MIKSATIACAIALAASHAAMADPVEDAAWWQRLSLAAEPTDGGCHQRNLAWMYGLDRVVWSRVSAIAGPNHEAQMRAVGMIDAARAGADDFAMHYGLAKPCETAVNFLALSEIDPDVEAAERIGGNVTLPSPNMIPGAVQQYAGFGNIIGMRLECGQRDDAWAAKARAALAPDIAGEDAFITGKLDAGDTAYLRGYETMMERWGHFEVQLIRPQLCAIVDKVPNAGLVDHVAGGQ